MEVGARGLQVDSRGPREREDSRMKNFSSEHPEAGEQQVGNKLRKKRLLFLMVKFAIPKRSQDILH